MESEWKHIVPLNDLKEHDSNDIYCHCNPTIDWNNMLCIHNSYDEREKFEQHCGKTTRKVDQYTYCCDVCGICLSNLKRKEFDNGNR